MATDYDNGLGLLDNLYDDSPFRDEDESSVDIYDGLDNTSAVPDNPIQLSSPNKNCLNLFDEILIEEGTAKEASYNDLQAEYGKCQEQIKELMKKFKEIQTQNSILQNENQALKKNISALIKTARVEINRKDEEISNLHQRLSEFPNHRSNYTRTYLPGSTNGRCSDTYKSKDSNFRAASVDNTRSDHKLKNDCSKDAHHNYSPHNSENEKLYSEKRTTPYLLRYPSDEHCSDGARTHPPNSEHCSDKDSTWGRKEVKNGEQYSRGNDNRYKRDAYQNTSNGTDSEQGNAESQRKLQMLSEKSDKNELQQESKSTKLKSSPATENRTDRYTTSWEKQATPKERSQTRVESHGDIRSERSQNMNRKDLKTYDKDEKNFGQKSKSAEKQKEPPRKFARGNSPHSRSETSRSSHKSSKCHTEDCKRGRETDCKRERGASDHNSREGRSPLSTSSSREHKYSHSKESSWRHEWETHSKSERHRTEERRKREKESQEESRHSRSERKVTKEVSHEPLKEYKKATDATRHERNKLPRPEEMSKVADGLKEQIDASKENQIERKNKDLKLSFMEKLNLTLSPAKKQCLCQTDALETDSKKVSDECSRETPVRAENPVFVQSSSIDSTEQTKSSLQAPDNIVLTNLEPVAPVSEFREKIEIEALTETLEVAESEALAETLEGIESELPVGDTVTLPESGIKMEETDEMGTAPDLEICVDQNRPEKIPLDELETITSDNMETLSVAENREMKSDSLMEVMNVSEHLSGESFVCPAEEDGISKSVQYKNDINKSEPFDGDVPVIDQNICNLDPNLSETDIGVIASSVGEEMDSKIQEREINPVSAEDESSILSIDLNHLRYIPKAISPLSSPMRPLAKALKMESPCKGLVKSCNKDLIVENAVVCPSKNLSNEVNKENQKPVSTSDEHLEMKSQLSTSSDELEEGEIVSEDEKSTPARNCENRKKSRARASPETHNLTSSPCNQMNKTACCNEDNGKLVSEKDSFKKSREKYKIRTKSSKEMKKNKTVSITCLEKIVQVIAEPSTVQEIMQMLRAIRKQIRKNYMKFKIHFPVQHFHRIIESAILNFTSLIKYLNFSKMSKLGDTLKLNLCDTIESKLKQVKKNATVDRLFEQNLSDMKKQLWKFVDEQLDYLFEKIRRIIVKLCDAVSVGSESDEGKLEIVTKQKHKICYKVDLQKSKKKVLKVRSQKPEGYVLSKRSYQSSKSHDDKNTVDAPKSAVTKYFNAIDNTRISQTKVQLPKENGLQGTLTPFKGTIFEKEGLQIARDANKSDFSFELLTEQQTSSLTFNLVSDAQMGEIFKSLLQGSDLLEKNISNIDRNQWELRTPEKRILESHKYRNNPVPVIEEVLPKEVCMEPRPVEDISWPVVSPVRVSSLSSRLHIPVDPDILDESCMFEVPTNATSGKDEECNLQKNKSVVSSILLEDLAVSLTIPSPLKSDAHLSFLKPENVSNSTPEGVLSAHYSEDALLEEEDATEQDIHLALESDNSSSRSSCSSSWTGRPAAPGFHCHPSLPMQAVIMEKSNDHFIVKIRRAVPSTSQILEQTTRTEESPATVTKNGKELIESAKMKMDHQSIIRATVKETVAPRIRLNNTDELHNVNIGQEQSPALLEPFKKPRNAIGKEEIPDLLKSVSEPSNKNSCRNENVSEDSKLPQLDELKVLESTSEITIRSEAGLPLEGGVDTHVCLTEDTGNENESNSCNLSLESTLNHKNPETHARSSSLGDKEHSECNINTCIDLTEDLSSETIANKCNPEIKSTSEVNELGYYTSLNDKASKKRKRESLADSSNSKRQRKETESSSEGNDKNSMISGERDLPPKTPTSTKNELPQNKDPTVSNSLSSTSSLGLYAKNIIKKKGEVVVSWTRNDDREILLECQKKGPSGKTFASIAARLNKSPNQVSERFKQLMKLFKKSKYK
ncbi:PREDICTED: CASP8-associated protein 2 [Crocodylus porosus]|uniref:CASP8-associated protein 2 n=1 Tax=Crocodylus porosus TaxID=8502 RepID=A0A7M4FGV8_CROPO|nr:PREDICTED: CASP8-associated protein 2 [Crocodylus porosus]